MYIRYSRSVNSPDPRFIYIAIIHELCNQNLFAPVSIHFSPSFRINTLNSERLAVPLLLDFSRDQSQESVGAGAFSAIAAPLTAEPLRKHALWSRSCGCHVIRYIAIRLFPYFIKTKHRSSSGQHGAIIIIRDQRSTSDCPSPTATSGIRGALKQLLEKNICRKSSGTDTNISLHLLLLLFFNFLARETPSTPK